MSGKTHLFRNSNTIAALTFCRVTAQIQTLPRFIWKNDVLAIFVTGLRTLTTADLMNQCFDKYITINSSTKRNIKVYKFLNHWKDLRV